MKSIFISTSSFAKFSDKPIELLLSNNINYKINDLGRKISEEEILTMLKDCDGVIAGTENYSYRILQNLPNLKVISRVGVGLDNIDLDFASANNIEIIKTKTSPSLAVAELTIGLIIDSLRYISIQNNKLKSGIWDKKMGSLLSGKKIGILGLGNIGKNLITLLSSFNLEFLAHDIKKDKDFEKKYNVKYCTLDDLLSKADIITLHLGLSAATKGLINYNSFKIMKKFPIIINTSRGEIIEESALVKALDEGLISGAALDVFCKEPYNGPLVNFDNVIVTPHIAAYAKEIRVQMEIEATKNIIKSLNYE